MTKDEIKKGLECCCNSDFKTACRNCLYLGSPRCNDTLCKDALNLITEQEQEIEKLKNENEELTKVVSSKVYDLIDNTKEIADAREVWEQQAKIEAVKDFAEDLKAKTMCIKEYEDGTRILQTSNKLIDQSVKIFLDELLKELIK